MFRSLTILSAFLTVPIWACYMAIAQDASVDSAEKDYSAELPRIAPLSAEQALREFDVQQGFEIQLVASEPLVTDPVAFAFDSKGRLWVIEMRDYSEQDTERLGRVALLTDTDHDGRMDHRSTFAENLSWPTAIWPWLDGVLVAEPPNITWYRDTNGDGLSDRSEVWYSGFGRSNVQGLVNSLRWGLDGWIHGATSSSGARLQASTGDARIELGRRDFAIDPISKTLRPETGGGQHGMGFNRWGDKFVTANSDHLQQVIDMESWLMDHASSVPIPALRRSIAEDGPQAEVFRVSPIEPWRIVRTRLRMSGVAPGIVEGGGRAAGYFTGATGTLIMDQESGFGLPDSDTAIVCDVGSNLVHRKSLTDQGLFFTSRRIDQQSELLRSRDIWFRPVQVGDGPDGALYIADMYREVIEHPQSLPPMIKKHLDLTSGRDRGRLWKLTSKAKPAVPFEDLSVLDDASLVARLGSEISWQRLMASQLLVERHSLGRMNADLVSRLLTESAESSPRPESRTLSLWLHHRLGIDVTAALASRLLAAQSNPRVLAHAIEVIGRSTLSDHQANAMPEMRDIQEQLIEIAGRADDSRVPLSLARLAPQLVPELRWRLLGALQFKAKEPLVRAVIAAAGGEQSWQLFRSDQAQELDVAEYAQWLSLLLPGWIAKVGNDTGLASFIQESLQSEHGRQKIWLAALSRHSSHSAVSNLLKQLDVQSGIDRQIREALEKQVGLDAVAWLSLATPEVQTEWMPQLIHSNSPEAIQSTAIAALSWANHPELMDHLIGQFRSMTPSLQQVALRIMASRPDRLLSLASALETGQIARSQIPAEIRQTLLSASSADLSERFAKVLSSASKDRAATIERYRMVLESSELARPDAMAGKAVFERSCAQCHRLGQVGSDVGPPLQQLGQKSPLQLLETILDPSREVDPKYAAYTVLTVEGVVINGIIIQESGNQLVIAEAGGRQTTLNRDDIEQIQSAGLSLMPEGLEEQISPNQMLDLIQYLLHHDTAQ